MERKGLRSFFGSERRLQNIWVLFSVPFVLFSLWARIEQGFYKKGIREGARRTAKVIYSDIILKASNQECKTIFVEQAGRKVDMVNVDCLRKKVEGDKDAKSVAKLNGNKKANGSVN